MDSMAGTNSLHSPQNNNGPIYSMPRKAAACAVTGVAFLVFTSMTFSVPALMPFSKYTLSYVICGIGCLLKAWRVYQYNRGEAQFKYAETLNNGDEKAHWIQKASDNGYAIAMREYAKHTGDQKLMIQAAHHGDDIAKQVVAEERRLREGIVKLIIQINWLKRVDRKMFSEDYLAEKIIERVREASTSQLTVAKNFVLLEIQSFNFKQDTMDKIKTNTGL